MSPGKIAAQAAHAETLAVQDLWSAHARESELDIIEREWLKTQQTLWSKWFGEGHYAKYIMVADDGAQLFTIKYYLEERGYRCYLVVDEGHTEGTYMVPTAMSIELIDKDDERSASIFGEFRLYKERTPQEDRSQRLLDVRISLGKRRRSGR